MKAAKAKGAASTPVPRGSTSTTVAVLKPAAVLKKPASVKPAKVKPYYQIAKPSVSLSSSPSPNRQTFNFLYRKMIINGLVGTHLQHLGSLQTGEIVLEALHALRTNSHPELEFAMSVPEPGWYHIRKCVADRRTVPYETYELKVEMDVYPLGMDRAPMI
jgi:hypothetical protein